MLTRQLYDKVSDKMKTIKYLPMKDMPRVKKPRERLRELGAQGLKDAELLALLLGSGYKGKNVLQLARWIISEHSLKSLAAMPFDKLKTIKGIGLAKACSVKAALELGKRVASDDGEEAIISPKHVADIAVNISRSKKENLVVLYLNVRNQLIHREKISTGILNANLVHPREVFQPAVAKSAASIILTHNHPSGNTTPSQEDIVFTKRLIKAGHLMGIEVLDHVIVTRKNYLSMKNDGLV